MRYGFLALLWFFAAIVPFQVERTVDDSPELSGDSVEQTTTTFSANGGIISVPDGKQ